MRFWDECTYESFWESHNFNNKMQRPRRTLLWKMDTISACEDTLKEITTAINIHGTPFQGRPDIIDWLYDNA